MRPRALLTGLEPRDFTRLRSYSAWCGRNDPAAAAFAGPHTTATKASKANEVRSDRSMTVLWRSSTRFGTLMTAPLRRNWGRFTETCSFWAAIHENSPARLRLHVLA